MRFVRKSNPASKTASRDITDQLMPNMQVGVAALVSAVNMHSKIRNSIGIPADDNKQSDNNFTATVTSQESQSHTPSITNLEIPNAENRSTCNAQSPTCDGFIDCETHNVDLIRINVSETSSDTVKLFFKLPTPQGTETDALIN